MIWLKKLLSGTVFFSQERATWPYDLMVIAVVAFVFLTPRSWFNDRPAVNVVPVGGGPMIQMVEDDVLRGLRTFRIEAGALASPRPDPTFERKAHEVLMKNVPELKGVNFRIERIEAGRDADGTVLYYDVSVKR